MAVMRPLREKCLVLVSRPFQLMIKLKSYRSDCEVGRTSIIVGYLINSICLVVAIGKYDLSVNTICESYHRGRLVCQI